MGGGADADAGNGAGESSGAATPTTELTPVSPASGGRDVEAEEEEEEEDDDDDDEGKAVEEGAENGVRAAGLPGLSPLLLPAASARAAGGPALQPAGGDTAAATGGMPAAAQLLLPDGTGGAEQPWAAALATAAEMLALTAAGLLAFAAVFAWLTSHPKPPWLAACALTARALLAALWRSARAAAGAASSVWRVLDWIGPLAAAGMPLGGAAGGGEVVGGAGDGGGGPGLLMGG